MLHSTKHLQRSGVVATDGAIGHVDDLYFDDEQWTIRYLVVDTASWRLGRNVLISPVLIRDIDWNHRVIALSIDRDLVRNSPDIDTHKPISRQHETEYLRYYQYPPYWGGVSLWGAAITPAAMGYASAIAASVDREPLASRERRRSPRDSHLRSTGDVIGYHIQASDGELGHVDDFLVDEETWAIRYAVVDTSNWWFGKKVLVATDWIANVSWEHSKVVVDVRRQTLKDAPPYDPHMVIDREWESRYFAHHDRLGYWETQHRSTGAPVTGSDHHGKDRRDDARG